MLLRGILLSCALRSMSHSFNVIVKIWFITYFKFVFWDIWRDLNLCRELCYMAFKSNFIHRIISISYRFLCLDFRFTRYNCNWSYFKTWSRPFDFWFWVIWIANQGFLSIRSSFWLTSISLDFHWQITIVSWFKMSEWIYRLDCSDILWRDSRPSILDHCFLRVLRMLLSGKRCAFKRYLLRSNACSIWGYTRVNTS